MKKILSSLVFLIMILNINGCGLNSDKASISSNSSNETEVIENEVPSIDEKDIEKEKSTDDKIDEQDMEKNDQENNKEEVKKAEAPKSKQRVVVIDPGHGDHSNMQKEEQSPGSGIMKIKDGGGAQGIATNTPEYVVNMSVAKKLKKLLEENNIKVIMTKTSHSESPGNIERANVGNDNNADLEIRIHCDSSDNQSANGASMLVPAKTGYIADKASISTKYGKEILDSLVANCKMKNRGVAVRNDMTGFNWSKVPVVLVEMGFMSNPNEDKLLNDDAYENKLAKGLCDGIVHVLK